MGTRFDSSDSGDLEAPSPVLPGVLVMGSPMGHQAGVGGSCGGDANVPQETSVTSGAGGGQSNDPQGTGGNPSQMKCSLGLTLCGDICSDTKVDAFNCGVCGHSCKAGQYCSAGVCTVSAVLYVSGDDSCTTYLDGKVVATNQNWFVATKATFELTAGTHVLAVRGQNAANGSHPGAIILDLAVGSERITTGSDWDSSTDFVAGWETLGGSLLNPVPPVTHEGIFSTTWWNRDSNTFAAKNFPNDSNALWIWSKGFLTDSVVYFRKEVVVE